MHTDYCVKVTNIMTTDSAITTMVVQPTIFDSLPLTLSSKIFLSFAIFITA